MKKYISIIALLFCFAAQGQFLGFQGRNFPNDTTYGLHYDTLIRGGYQVYYDTINRDKIPFAQRKLMMKVATIKDSCEWQLLGGLGNNSWKKIVIGGGTDTNYAYSKSQSNANFQPLENQRLSKANSPQFNGLTTTGYVQFAAADGLETLKEGVYIIHPIQIGHNHFINIDQPNHEIYFSDGNDYIASFGRDGGNGGALIKGGAGSITFGGYNPSDNSNNYTVQAKELGRLQGVSSNIQDQLNGKQSTIWVDDGTNLTLTTGNKNRGLQTQNFSIGSNGSASFANGAATIGSDGSINATGNISAANDINTSTSLIAGNQIRATNGSFVLSGDVGTASFANGAATIDAIGNAYFYNSYSNNLTVSGQSFFNNGIYDTNNTDYYIRISEESLFNVIGVNQLFGTEIGTIHFNLLGNAPSSSSAFGSIGEIRFDTNYGYRCVANNQWKRWALSSY